MQSVTTYAAGESSLYCMCGGFIFFFKCFAHEECGMLASLSQPSGSRICCCMCCAVSFQGIAVTVTVGHGHGHGHGILCVQVCEP
jgi:hypothetical protein